MNILLVTPFKPPSTRGNRITADRISGFLRELGHRVEVATELPNPVRSHCNLLIALHARRSAKAIAEFRNRLPDRPIVVVITGTDIHCDLQKGPTVLDSLNRADRIVLLEPECRKRLPRRLHRKCSVILQSAEKLNHQPESLKRWFEVSIVGHLRPIKDPFLIVKAARRLPEESKIRIVHIGEALSPSIQRRASRYTRDGLRYRWIGERPHGETVRRIARSRITVLTSLAEGAPSVFSEAIVNGVPVLSTRIDAAIGMLGRDYGGLFPVGDDRKLAQLLMQAESHSEFMNDLINQVSQLAPRYQPSCERDAWRKLLGTLA